MSGSKVSYHVQPCIWMSAGLLSYKLCDRDFDCDHCPLDAALRGEARPSFPNSNRFPEGSRPVTFPTGLLYSSGHTWLRPIDDKSSRVFAFGVDSLAASLIGRVRETSWSHPGSRVRRGETVCQIGLVVGPLSLLAPLTSRIVQGNPVLGRYPDCVVEDPYGEGWILQIEAEDEAQMKGLMSPTAAADQARLDLQHFRRKAAQYLLQEVESVGPCLQDGGRGLTDLRSMLGALGYLNLLKELVH